MTYKTDIAALPKMSNEELEGMRSVAMRRTEPHVLFEIRHAAQKTLSVLDELISLREQLEAERQQRGAAEAELAELRGEQEPDGYIFCHPTGKLFWSIVSETCAGDDGVRPYYFTHPPKPVVVLSFEQWCDRRGEKPLGWVRDAMKEAYSGALETAGIVVKDGE